MKLTKILSNCFDNTKKKELQLFFYQANCSNELWFRSILSTKQLIEGKDQNFSLMDLD